MMTEFLHHIWSLEIETESHGYVILYLTGLIILTNLILILMAILLHDQMVELESLRHLLMRGGKTHHQDQDRSHQSEQ